MKILLKLCVCLTVLFFATQAHAMRWYSPSTGRWLSRDPIGEKGGLNLYGFVKNNPENGFDALGLIEFDGCSEQQKSQLRNAWDQACEKLGNQRFQTCLNRCGLLQLLKRRCDWGNVTFQCRQTGSLWCPEGTCANSWQSIIGGINRGVIVVCYPTIEDCRTIPGGPPGAISCILLHELAHVVTASPLHTPNSAAVSAELCCEGMR